MFVHHARAGGWLLALLSAWSSVSFAAPVPEPLAHLTCSSCLSESDVRGRFSKDEWQRLNDGDPLTRDRAVTAGEDTEKREAEAFGIITLPPSVVWDVLVDFESRPKFMSTSTESTITKVEGADVYVRQQLKILWETIRFSVINVVDPNKGTISWTIDKTAPRDIAETTGAWQVAPLDQGKHTLLLYRSHTDTGKPVPAVIESYLLKRSLPKMIETVRDETMRRGKGKAYLLPDNPDSER